jgi:hypothetical protein
MKQTYFKVWKRAILSLGLASLIFSACKKSNDNSNPEGLSAALGGKSWSAATTVAWGDNYSVDVNSASADQTAVEVYVNNKMKAGQADAFDNSYIYVEKSSGSYYESYANLSHGSVTFNSWDSTSATKRISGVFSGTLYNPDNSKDSLVITNGKFNTPYTTEP